MSDENWQGRRDEVPRAAHIEALDGGRVPRLGEAVFIHESAVVIGAVTLADEVSVWPNVTLRGDEGRIEIGRQTNIQDGTTIHMTGDLSHTIVGERVTVGHGCILHGCIVGDGALIGMGAILLDNATIGEGAFIGAGALVTQNKVIPPRTMVFGNPAKVVRELTPEEIDYTRYAWRHYVEQAALYQSLRAASPRRG
ncbi:MAG: gamma carbonic anhydrase family protein [Deltaproteobacteria bacterium]|nr:gamma carbonic anhydrase family protein [Deltaproteobacteria bacterium]